MKKKTVADAVKILHERYYKGNARRQESLERERLNAKIARDIYQLRIAHDLTQRQLADLVGTSASVISRLESADYAGHSLNMLQRIAAVFNQKVQVSFVPLRSPSRTALESNPR